MDMVLPKQSVKRLSECEPSSKIMLFPTNRRIQQRTCTIAMKTFELAKKKPIASTKLLQVRQFAKFNLKELEMNKPLLENRKYSNLLERLRLYNHKIEEIGEDNIINYKLYEFLHSTLKICNTKTITEVQMYLAEINKWHSDYIQKRVFAFPKKDRPSVKKVDDEAVRQNYKSILPEEVDQYRRKKCTLSIGRKKKSTKSEAMSSLEHDFHEQSKEDSDDEYAQKLDSASDNEEEEKKKTNDLPALRTFKMEILKMRKNVEDREQQAKLQGLKHNQSRIQSQSSNNFYNPMKNKNDIFKCLKSQQFVEEKQNINNKDYTEKSLLTSNAKATARKAPFSITTQGFYEIKKKRLNTILGLRVPCQNSAAIDITIQDAEGSLSRVSEMEANCIDGINLIKNPYEIVKGKKGKKKK